MQKLVTEKSTQETQMQILTDKYDDKKNQIDQMHKTIKELKEVNKDVLRRSIESDRRAKDEKSKAKSSLEKNDTQAIFEQKESENVKR